MPCPCRNLQNSFARKASRFWKRWRFKAPASSKPSRKWPSSSSPNSKKAAEKPHHAVLFRSLLGPAVKQSEGSFNGGSNRNGTAIRAVRRLQAPFLHHLDRLLRKALAGVLHYPDISNRSFFVDGYRHEDVALNLVSPGFVRVVWDGTINAFRLGDII